jgi:hypothetical protein
MVKVAVGGTGVKVAVGGAGVKVEVGGAGVKVLVGGRVKVKVAVGTGVDVLWTWAHTCRPAVADTAAERTLLVMTQVFCSNCPSRLTVLPTWAT